MTKTIALAVVSIFSGLLALPAPAQITDPVSFISEVYRHFTEAGAGDRPYTPPEDIYTMRLSKLIRDDERRAKGEVGCLDFSFWINAQDYMLTNVGVTSGVAGRDRTTVIAKFVNFEAPQELHFDFRRTGERWLLDDVHSVKDPSWTLSKMLKCKL